MKTKENDWREILTRHWAKINNVPADYAPKRPEKELTIIGIDPGPKGSITVTYSPYYCGCGFMAPDYDWPYRDDGDARYQIYHYACRKEEKFNGDYISHPALVACRIPSRLRYSTRVYKKIMERVEFFEKYAKKEGVPFIKIPAFKVALNIRLKSRLLNMGRCLKIRDIGITWEARLRHIEGDYKILLPALATAVTGSDMIMSGKHKIFEEAR